MIIVWVWCTLMTVDEHMMMQCWYVYPYAAYVLGAITSPGKYWRIRCPASWHQSHWSWSHSSTSLGQHTVHPISATWNPPELNSWPHNLAESLWLFSVLPCDERLRGVNKQYTQYSIHRNYRKASRPLLSGWRMGGNRTNFSRKNTGDLVWLSNIIHI